MTHILTEKSAGAYILLDESIVDLDRLFASLLECDMRYS